MTLRWICGSLLAMTQLISTQPGFGQAPVAPASSRLTDKFANRAAGGRMGERNFKTAVCPDKHHSREHAQPERPPASCRTPYDKDNAEWILAKFKEPGDSTPRLKPSMFCSRLPRNALVEMVEPDKIQGQDPGTRRCPQIPPRNQTSEQLPTYNAYSADGDVTAPLVYVNYGNREDYEQLDRLGVSVKGAIVIARYGDSWRGIKPKVAAEHGAIGCIIYSDPDGDGFYHGDDYPTGRLAAARWSSTRQRDGHRLSGRSAHSWRGRDRGRQAALHQGSENDHEDSGVADFLRRCAAAALGAQRSRRSGKLARGPGHHLSRRARPAKVHLKVASNWDIKPIYDVIAHLAGRTAATVGHSRQSSRRLGKRRRRSDFRHGAPCWKKRGCWASCIGRDGIPGARIIYCAWDGEEPGLLGSVEWVETHVDELKATRRRIHQFRWQRERISLPGGTQDLQTFISGVARDMQDPETHTSVFQRSHLASIARAKDADERDAVRKRSDLLVERAGRRIGLHSVSGFRRHIEFGC